MKALSISICFISVLLISQLHNSLVITVYELNSTHYTEVLCENKTQANSSCGGKCVLMSQFKNKANDNQVPAKFISGIELLQFYVPSFNWRSDIANSKSKSRFQTFAEEIRSQVNKKIDHPPERLV